MFQIRVIKKAAATILDSTFSWYIIQSAPKPQPAQSSANQGR